MKKALVFISMLFGLFMLAFTASCEMDTDSGDNTSIVNPINITRFVNLTIQYYRVEKGNNVTIREDEFTDVEVSDTDNSMFDNFVNSKLSKPENDVVEKDGIRYTYVYDRVVEYNGVYSGDIDRIVKIRVLFHVDEYVIPPTPTYTITVRNFYDTNDVMTKTVEEGTVIDIEDYITEQMKKVNLKIGNVNTDTYICYDYLVNEDGTEYDPTLPITSDVTLYPHITVPKTKMYGNIENTFSIVRMEEDTYYAEYRATMAFYKTNPINSSLGGHLVTIYGVIEVTTDYVSGIRHTYININSSYKHRITMEVNEINLNRDVIHVVYKD